MGTNIKLTAADGNQFEAYVAESPTTAQAAVVVLQEIFGLNRHIRSVADDYAGHGFWAIAPALFDRVQHGLELGYEAGDVAEGMSVATRIGLDVALRDVAASVEHAGRLWSTGKVGVVGYCLGGTLAWLSATRLAPAAVVCYYGGRIAEHAAEFPHCPVMMHFGNRDAHIPSSEIETIRRFHPDLPLFVYDAGHGFNCDQRRDYEPREAALARQRSIEFLHSNLS